VQKRNSNEHTISELERRHLIIVIEQALAEMEQSEDFSQGTIDDLRNGVEILGGAA
jgi:hypothetical protein